MSNSAFITALLAAFGVWGLIAVAVIGLSWRFIQRWLNRRIEAGVDHGLRVRLAEHQHGLNKQLEEHRSELESEREKLRSGLDKTTADYRIYIERRANAVSELFAAFLAAELKAIDRSMFMLPAADDLNEEGLEQLLSRLQVKSQVAAQIREAWNARSGADSLIREAAHALKYKLAMDARENAHDAYFRTVLYLPPAIEQAALAVRDYFHTVAGDHAIPSERGPKYVEHKTRLRFLMLELQNAARHELGASAP
jgi:hypothetical protein